MPRSQMCLYSTVRRERHPRPPVVQYTVPLVCDVREKPDIAELYRDVSRRGFPLPGNPTLRGQGTLRVRTADPRVS